MQRRLRKSLLLALVVVSASLVSSGCAGRWRPTSGLALPKFPPMTFYVVRVGEEKERLVCLDHDGYNTLNEWTKKVEEFRKEWE